MPCAVWHPRVRVQVSASESWLASADRGSRKTGETRLLTSVTSTTCAAAANAASVASRSPCSRSKVTLRGLSSHTGVEGARACSYVVTAGRGSYSTVTASAASSACTSVSATTIATGSPAYRAFVVASAGWPGSGIAVPSRFSRANGGMRASVGTGPIFPSMSRLVRTHSTPSIARAVAV